VLGRRGTASANVVAASRAYGEGLIIAEQIPSKILIGVPILASLVQ
jgi:hypothetical protein